MGDGELEKATGLQNTIGLLNNTLCLRMYMKLMKPVAKSKAEAANGNSTALAIWYLMPNGQVSQKPHNVGGAYFSRNSMSKGVSLRKVSKSSTKG